MSCRLAMSWVITWRTKNFNGLAEKPHPPKDFVANLKDSHTERKGA
jgi:hypothetical protein